MKVIHLLYTGFYSGAENVVITMIKAMPADIQSIYVSPDGPIRQILGENGIKYYSVEKMTISAIKKAIHNINPDVIHAHDYLMGTLAVLTGTPIPIINHLHNNAPWIKKISPLTLTYLYVSRFFKKILIVSESISKEFVFGRQINKKCLTIGNPIDIKAIKKKSEMNQCLDDYDVVFLGRMIDAKSPFLFLEIIDRVLLKCQKLKVVMIGNGELFDSVYDRIEQTELKGHIHMLGFQKNPLPILKKGKLLCMPSKWEGFGMAAIEAMALGLPVVSSDAGGLQVIVDDYCGKKCTTIGDYVDEICNLLNNADYYERKKQSASKKAKELENINQYVKILYDTYCEIVY